MRAASLAFVLALLPAAATQGVPFTDPDFGFAFTLPPGLKAVDEAGLARILGNEVSAKNVARAEAGGKPVAHHYVWLDETSPYDRQVSISLLDGMPPWKPEDFPEGMAKQGVKVETSEMLKAPVAGMRIEGTFQREPDKIMLRKTVVYMPDPYGKRYAIVTLQAFAADWNIVKDEFHEAVNSARLQRTPVQQAAPGAQAPPGKAGRPPGQGQGKGKGAPAAGAAGAPEQDSGDWGSLKVVGSFVLAAVVLGHLLLSGRPAR